MIEHIMLIQGIIERGLIFALVTAGVYIASRVINFDNLAVEGAFGLGGALAAQTIMMGFNPWLSVLAASIIGMFSGIATGLLHTKLKLNNLISGIVVTTGAFSIMLKLAGSNMPLGGKSTIFSSFSLPPYNALLILVPLITLTWYGIILFLNTEVGLILKATGENPFMLANIGKNVNHYKILGITLSNTLAAFSGALFVHYLGYFSIWSSVGVLIISLASLIIAETFSTGFGIALILGSIAYQTIIAFTFELQLNQDWNKLATSLLIILLVSLKHYTNKK